MTQAAYARNEKTTYRAPDVKVVQGGRARRRTRRLDTLRQLAHTFRMFLAAGVILFLVSGLIYSQARITELSGDIEKERDALVKAQSNYDYLSGQMDDITSSTNIAAVAQAELGLVKADASQITYVDLEDEGLIVRSESTFTKLLSSFQTAALSLLGSLDP